MHLVRLPAACIACYGTLRSGRFGCSGRGGALTIHGSFSRAGEVCTRRTLEGRRCLLADGLTYECSTYLGGEARLLGWVGKVRPPGCAESQSRRLRPGLAAAPQPPTRS